MDSMDEFLKSQPPTALRPLLGQTILAVEDSRFACEAIRLVCLRSGARVRRADSLGSARRHLRVYRPSVVLVDMGLPDGSGADLIGELASASPRVAVLLGTSGDDALIDQAIAAGADGFIAKPIVSLAGFQNEVLKHLPWDRQPKGPRAVMDDAIAPDSIAYQDDLAHAVEALDAGEAAYVAQFLEGLARCGGDTGLARQAERLARAPKSREECAQMDMLLRDRLGERVAV
ncbi:MAG: response regulator [Pseudomonadota bacterium]